MLLMLSFVVPPIAGLYSTKLNEYNKALADTDEDNKKMIEEEIKNTWTEKIIEI